VGAPWWAESWSRQKLAAEHARHTKLEKRPLGHTIPWCQMGSRRRIQLQGWLQAGRRLEVLQHALMLEHHFFGLLLPPHTESIFPAQSAR
jgi:hypothetical protein